jgi:hypothetical protein
MHNSRVARQVNKEEKLCEYEQDQRGLTIVQGDWWCETTEIFEERNLKQSLLIGLLLYSDQNTVKMQPTENNLF